MALILSATLKEIDMQAYLPDVAERLPTTSQSDFGGLLLDNLQLAGKMCSSHRLVTITDLISEAVMREQAINRRSQRSHGLTSISSELCSKFSVPSYSDAFAQFKGGLCAFTLLGDG